MRENCLSGSMRGGARRSWALGLSPRRLRLLYFFRISNFGFRAARSDFPPDFIFRSSQVTFGHPGSSRRPERRRGRPCTYTPVTGAGLNTGTARSGNGNLLPQAHLVVSASGPTAPSLSRLQRGRGRATNVVIVDDSLTTTSRALLVEVGLLAGGIDEKGIVNLDDYFLVVSRWYQRNTCLRLGISTSSRTRTRKIYDPYDVNGKRIKNSKQIT